MNEAGFFIVMGILIGVAGGAAFVISRRLWQIREKLEEIISIMKSK